MTERRRVIKAGLAIATASSLSAWGGDLTKYKDDPKPLSELTKKL